MRFSERLGLTPVRTAIQGRSLDQATRARLWSAVAAGITEHKADVRLDFSRTWMYELYRHVWVDYFKEPVDELPDQVSIRTRLKRVFMEGSWYESFDLLEFVLNSRFSGQLQNLSTKVDLILSEEVAGFRWMHGRFVEITDETEIKAIEAALATADSERYRPARSHIVKALEFLSDRQAPDYRNSIKESISAVEGVVRILSGEPRVEFGKGLRLLGNLIPVHGAFLAGLGSLYGFTSDASGIRHALNESPTVDAADAKFMLVICAAFLVYLIQKVDGS